MYRVENYSYHKYLLKNTDIWAEEKYNVPELLQKYLTTEQIL